jgi:hypothetical protein
MQNDLLLDGQVIAIADNFKTVLDSHQHHLKSFCAYGIQAEGWFKGELLTFLDSWKARREIANFDREVNLAIDQRKKVDFRIDLSIGGQTIPLWIELKHWLIGRQKGVRYNAAFYFADPTSIGISHDVKKLADISDGGRYLFILSTANPGHDAWEQGLLKFNQKFAPLSLKNVHQEIQYPESYFLGIVRA